MEAPQVPFYLQSETATKQSPRLQQIDLFPQWYEYYVVNPTDDDIPLPPQRTPKPIKAWWLKNQYA